MTLYELRKLAKEGNAAQAYAELSSMTHEEISAQKENAGWIIFYRLREVISGGATAEAVNGLIDMYAGIDIPRPSLLHSNMLRLAGKACEAADGLDMLTLIHRLDPVFKDEDYHSTMFNGKQMTPLFDVVAGDCFEQNMEFGPTYEMLSNCPVTLERLLETYGRCIYRRLWQYNSEENDEQKSYALVRKYLEQTDAFPQRKGKMHSVILNSIIWDTHDETTGWFKDIFEKWGMNSFTDEDWKPVTKGEETYDSLAEKAISKYIQAMKAVNQAPAPEFRELIEKALEHFPENETYLRYSAKYKVKDGLKDEARELYRRMILAGNKYYLWSELAELVDEVDLKIACLAKATTLQKDDKFLVQIRLDLASQFISKGLYDAALHELNIHEETCRLNEWRIKNRFMELRARIPQGTIASTGNKALYHEYIPLCDGFIYSSLPAIEAVVTGIRVMEVDGKKKTRVLLKCANGETVKANALQCGIKTRCNNGDLFDIKMVQGQKGWRVVWMKDKGSLKYETVTVTRVDKAQGLFFFSGENGVSGRARIDKTGFTPEVNSTLSIARFKTVNREGNPCLIIIDVRRS